MGIIHRGEALHREEYGWLLCLIVLKKEEINKDAFSLRLLDVLRYFP